MKRHLLFCIGLILVMLGAACAAANSARSGTAQTPQPAGQTASPTPDAAAAPTTAPTAEPTTAPTAKPTSQPTAAPTAEPTSQPTAVPTAEPTPQPTAAPTIAPSTNYPEINTASSALLGETEDMGQSYLDDIIFLGDSTTYGLKAYGMLKDGRNTKQVWTPTSGTLTLSYQGFAAIWYPDEDVEITIREAVERKQPKMMIITLGVNGISFMDEAAFTAEYTDLVEDIQALSPDTQIIIQSIFPVARNYEYLGSINNEKITTANTWLLKIAEDTGVRYLNTISVLMGEDGYLPESYQNGDGLHLNDVSFSLVLNYIRTHGYSR